jgi:hypothetical protein
MKATVVLVNQTRGMVAAKTEDGEYSIFELLGGYDIEVGDVVSSQDFHSMGGGTYRNVTKNEDMDVYVQNVVGNIEQARRQVFLA